MLQLLLTLCLDLAAKNWKGTSLVGKKPFEYRVDNGEVSLISDLNFRRLEDNSNVLLVCLCSL